MSLDAQVARLVDIDPETGRSVDALLDRMDADDRRAAGALQRILIAELGAFSATAPQIPDCSPAAWVAAVLAAAPTVAGWMTDRGVPEPVITQTLADVGRHLRLQRRNAGLVGFDAPIWMFAVLSGSLYQLGRLQFDLRPRRAGEVDLPAGLGEWLLDVHIPEAGPLIPALVADSFDLAVPFFAAHFPDRPVLAAVCGSWLLNPYLAEHLSPSSNVVAFQRLFTPYGEPRDDQLDAVYFTFGQRSLQDLDRLPRASSLQRLVLDRLQGGQRWQVVHGYRVL